MGGLSSVAKEAFPVEASALKVKKLSFFEQLIFLSFEQLLSEAIHRLQRKFRLF